MILGKRRRWRYFRQRFDPTAQMVFRKKTTVLGADIYLAGEPVPEELPVRFLRKFWKSERIELRDYTPPKQAGGVRPR